MSSSLAYTRSGSGASLVLLHGIGLNRSSWNPVVPTLAVAELITRTAARAAQAPVVR